MTGATVTASLRAAPVMAAMKRLAAVGHDGHGLMAAIGVGLVETTQHRFETARDPEGRPWAPLLPAYAAIKKGPGILRGRGMSGGLMGSITFAATASSVRVGSNKQYAAVHQFGAVIRPVRAPALAFFLGGVALGPRGGRKVTKHLVLAKKVTVPARPYLGFGAADRAVVLERVETALAQALGGAGV